MCSPLQVSSNPPAAGGLGTYGKSVANGLGSGATGCSGRSKVVPLLSAKQLRRASRRRARRALRFIRQEEARRLMQGCSVSRCMLGIIPGRQGVDVVLHRPTGDASFQGLITCGSVWMCPVCAAKVGARRAVELQKAVDQWHKDGGKIVLLTLTARHKRDTNLKVFLESFLKAEKRLHQSRSWRELKASGMLVGSIRAMEVTWGDRNGWHPHSHSLLFIDGCSQGAAVSLVESLRDQWSRSLELSGLDCTEVGFSAQGGDAAAEYVGKWGHEPEEDTVLWGAAQEVALASVKEGRRGGLTPWELLDLSLAGDGHKGKLFQEYCRTFKGRRQLTWSPGLQARFDIVELSDENLAAAEGEDTEPVAHVLREEWKAVVRFGYCQAVLDAAEEEGEAGVYRVLREVMAREAMRVMMSIAV